MSVAAQMKSLSMNDKENGPETYPPALQGVLDEIQREFDQRMACLEADLQDSKRQQLQAYNQGMLKLNKNVRNMKVSEFQALYKMDLLGVAKRIRETATKKRDRPDDGSVGTAETARNNKTKSSLAMATPSRHLRRGENLFSKNGSPVVVNGEVEETEDSGTLVATVAKKRRQFQLHVGDGRTINLNDTKDVANLNREEQESAYTQLMIMQDDIAQKLQLFQQK